MKVGLMTPPDHEWKSLFHKQTWAEFVYRAAFNSRLHSRKETLNSRDVCSSCGKMAAGKQPNDFRSLVLEVAWHGIRNHLLWSMM